ncbi:hypothetical protein Fot_24983 [Forsythia ovata]|uniref:Uncharacterized protein n=1 Tax=Forsythia ovata TaxID=205694 RepID=A0ABD1U934_9LAMI
MTKKPGPCRHCSNRYHHIDDFYALHGYPEGHWLHQSHSAPLLPTHPALALSANASSNGFTLSTQAIYDQLQQITEKIKTTYKTLKHETKFDAHHSTRKFFKFSV